MESGVWPMTNHRRTVGRKKLSMHFNSSTSRGPPRKGVCTWDGGILVGKKDFLRAYFAYQPFPFKSGSPHFTPVYFVPSLSWPPDRHFCIAFLGEVGTEGQLMQICQTLLQRFIRTYIVCFVRPKRAKPKKVSPITNKFETCKNFLSACNNTNKRIFLHEQHFRIFLHLLSVLVFFFCVDS